MSVFLSISCDKLKNTHMAPLREVHGKVVIFVGIEMITAFLYLKPNP